MTSHTGLPSLAPLLVVSLAAALGTASLEAQCGLAIERGFGLGSNARTTVSWDPDGAGPAAPVLVAAKRFGSFGPAFWDSASHSWIDFASAPQGDIKAFAIDNQGDLLAATVDVGPFTTDGYVSRWNGNIWLQIGNRLPDRPTALAVLPNGDIYVGGDFQTIRRFDGSSWIAATQLNGMVNELAVTSTGELIAVGDFTSVGGTPSNRVALWNGTAWQALGTGCDATVRATTTLPSGDVIVAGDFLAAGATAAARIARWDGSTWHALGAGCDAAIRDLVLDRGGDVIAGGDFSLAGGNPANHIARWNGTGWQSLGAGTSAPVEHLGVDPIGDVVAAGDFVSAGAIPVDQMARWSGTTWRPFGFGAGSYTTPYCAAVLADGSLAIGGSTIGGTGEPNLMVRRNAGDGWRGLPNGVSTAVTMAVLANGDLVAGGIVDALNGLGVARWNGTVWQPLGPATAGSSGWPQSLFEAANGDLLAGGNFLGFGAQTARHIARWNGTTWQPLGAGTNDAVYAILELPNGDVIAGGDFVIAGPLLARGVARWDGTSWHTMGQGLNGGVRALVLLPDGTIVAGGFFTLSGTNPVSRVARWNGTSWQPLGTGISNSIGSVSVRALQVLPDGSLLAGGRFDHAGGVATSGLARWAHGSWHAVSPGLDRGSGGTRAIVYDLALTHDGRAFAAGDFFQAGGIRTVSTAVAATPCPARTAPTGGGCPGAGSLTADHDPWLGATFRATATGTPNTGLGAAVFGFTPQQLPLVSLTPLGRPLCELRTTADATVFFALGAGNPTTNLPIPVDPGLTGVTLHHQILALELDASNQPIELTSTNALRLEIGSY